MANPFNDDEQNAKITWDFLKYELGLDDHRAAAAMGNLSWESHFDTGALSDDGHQSLGIAQWTFGRKMNLLSMGGDPLDIYTQLRHFKNEVSEGGERRYAFVNLLNNSGDLRSLTDGWCDDFEAPDPELAYKNKRLERAEYYLNLFGEGRDQSFTGAFMSVLEPGYAKETGYTAYGDLNPAVNDYDDGYDDALEDMGTLEAAASNLWDSITESGIATALEYTWGGIAHSGKMWFEPKDPVTQEDVDFVQQSLPGDKDAQQFILLNGRDRKEIQWLVNQKLVEHNRKANIARWKAQNDSIIAKFVVGSAGAAGYIVDPLNLIPAGSALKGSMMLGRLGKALLNPAKAREIASVAAKTGYEFIKMNAPLTGSVIANDYLKESFSGQKQNYAFDAATAMLAGTVLSVAGYGAGKAFSKFSARNTLSDEVAAVADRAETISYREAAGETAEKIRSETIGEMRALHDADFSKMIRSRIYDRFTEKGRVLAVPYEKARGLVSRLSGRELPQDAKAFYVPNEDYTVLITDNIKDAAQAERVLAHEFAVHAGLHQSLGKKEYASLMNQVKQAMNKDGHVFNELRRKYDTQDPEEVFAHAVEDGVLPDGITSKIKGIFNSALGREGYNARMTQDDIMELLRKQAEEERSTVGGFHFNPDGSTAFAGMVFSRDNLLNPNIFYDMYALEPIVTESVQGALPRSLQRFGRWMERSKATATPFGLMMNSSSHAARRFATQLFGDVRNRGIGSVKTMAAEDQKEAIQRRLAVHLGDINDARLRWMGENKKLPTRSAQLAFDKMVQVHYNAKYGGNKATLLADVPREVEEAVETVERYRLEQIDIGKNSARMFGSQADNLIEKEWYEVDKELWRTVDMDARRRFFAHYNTRGMAEQDLADYYRTFAKRDVIREKILRDIRMENARIDKKNIGRKERGLEPLEKREELVSDEAVEEWLEARIPAAVEHALQTNLDP